MRARRWIAALAAALSLMALIALPAFAEIIDFDPFVDEVPGILDPEERAKIEALMDMEFVFLYTEPSPAGRYVLAYVGGDTSVLDLSTGDEIPADGLPDYLYPGDMVWVDDVTLGGIGGRDEGDGETPDIRYYRFTMNVESGETMEEELEALANYEGGLMAYGPDLQTLLMIAAAEEGSVLPDPVEITLGLPTFEDTRLPEDVDVTGLPGRVGSGPLGTVEVQQAAARLLLLDADGGNERELMEMAEDTAVVSVSWKPGGSQVSVVTREFPEWDGDRQRDNEPGNRPIEPHLGSANVQEALGKVAPEDNALLQQARAAVFAVGDGSEVTSIANGDLPQGLIAQIAWSPTGSRALLAIALRSEIEGREHPVYSFPSGIEIHVLDGETLEIERELEGYDLPGTGMSFLDDDHVLASVADELDTRLDRVSLADGSAETVWAEPGAMYQAIGRGELVLFTHMTVDTPIELMRGEVSDLSGTLETITDINFLVAEESAVVAHEVQWTTADGETLHGLYVQHEDMPWPPAERSPLVVWQQGGPGGQMVNDFGNSVEAPYSLLPQFQVPVLIANAAGRTVKSRAFFTSLADGDDFGQVDIGQIKEGVESLAGEGIVDLDRVGVTGCSYGGYFTMQSVRTYPDFYAAANPQCSLVDLYEEFTFGYAPVVSYLMGRGPFDSADEYRQDSPMYGTAEVTTPSLIFHGRQDFLPFQLINNIHDQLAENGVDVRFLRVDNEGHGFGQPESQAYASQLQLEFFREKLRIGEPPVGPTPTPMPPPGGTIYLPMTMVDFEPAPEQ